MLACASLVASQGANGQAVFECKGPDGTLYFTDRACPNGSIGSIEQRASQAQSQSRVDAADPRKQMETEEAYEGNLAARQIREANHRAAITQRDAAISSSIANANAQDSRNRMAEAARERAFRPRASEIPACLPRTKLNFRSEPAWPSRMPQRVRQIWMRLPGEPASRRTACGTRIYRHPSAPSSRRAPLCTARRRRRVSGSPKATWMHWIISIGRSAVRSNRSASARSRSPIHRALIFSNPLPRL